MTTHRQTRLSRRRLLQHAAGIVGVASVPGVAAPVVAQTRPPVREPHPGDITARLAKYMVQARDRTLPPGVISDAKHRVLDSIGAIVSGSRLKPGEMAIRYVRALPMC